MHSKLAQMECSPLKQPALVISQVSEGQDSRRPGWGFWPGVPRPFASLCVWAGQAQRMDYLLPPQARAEAKGLAARSSRGLAVPEIYSLLSHIQCLSETGLRVS